MKTALITGSSRGIGKSIALRLANDGFKVFVHCSGDTSNADSVKEEIVKNGGAAEVVSANLCNLSETKELFNKTGNIDVLVLNASIQIKKPWEEITEEDTIAQFNCNYHSSLLLIQKAVPYMKKQGWGRIVTIGSVQEAKPHPDMLVYSSTKAAQTNMVKSLAVQLAPFGITVNNVAPGVIYTDRNKEALSNTEYAKKVTDSIPVGFYGTPDDCVPTVSLLCSDDSRYITGQSIYVDGGKSL